MKLVQSISLSAIVACSAMVSMSAPVTVGYDALPAAGSGFLTGGVLFEMDVAPNRNLVIERFEFQVRPGQTSVWDYTLYHRNGSLADVVDGQPAHRVAAAWQPVGSAPGMASPESPEWFDIVLGEGLALGPGRHAFYLDSTLADGASGSSNGVRVADPQDFATTDLFDPFFNLGDFTLLRGGSKGSAFGSTDPMANLRAPREMFLTYRGGDGERVAPHSPGSRWTLPASSQSTLATTTGRI